MNLSRRAFYFEKLKNFIVRPFATHFNDRNHKGRIMKSFTIPTAASRPTTPSSKNSGMAWAWCPTRTPRWRTPSTHSGLPALAERQALAEPKRARNHQPDRQRGQRMRLLPAAHTALDGMVGFTPDQTVAVRKDSAPLRRQARRPGPPAQKHRRTLRHSEPGLINSFVAAGRTEFYGTHVLYAFQMSKLIILLSEDGGQARPS